MAPLGAMRPSTADSTITIVINHMGITMSTIEARVEVLAAAVRAMAISLTSDQAERASATLLHYVRPIADRRMPASVDQVVAAEVASLMLALAR